MKENQHDLEYWKMLVITKGKNQQVCDYSLMALSGDDVFTQNEISLVCLTLFLIFVFASLYFSNLAFDSKLRAFSLKYRESLQAKSDKQNKIIEVCNALGLSVFIIGLIALIGEKLFNLAID